MFHRYLERFLQSDLEGGEFAQDIFVYVKLDAVLADVEGSHWRNKMPADIYSLAIGHYWTQRGNTCEVNVENGTAETPVPPGPDTSGIPS